MPMRRFLFEDSQGLYCMALAGSEEKARASVRLAAFETEGENENT